MCREPRIQDVPIKPHLKKFLLTTADIPEPYRLDQHSSIGKRLMSAIRHKHEPVNMDDRLSETISLELSSDIRKMSPRVGQLLHINTLLDEMFQESLITWIIAQSYAGVNPHNSCKSFLFFLRIDENEYTYDAAYKAWQRYKGSRRERLKMLAKRKKVSPKMF